MRQTLPRLRAGLRHHSLVVAMASEPRKRAKNPAGTRPRFGLPAPEAACIRAVFLHMVPPVILHLRDRPGRQAPGSGLQESEMASNNGAIKLVAGNSNPALAEGI